MIILHAAAISDASITGPGVSVPSLAAAQNELQGVHAAVVTTIAGGEKLSNSRVPVFTCKALLGNNGRIDLPAPFNTPDLVVFHSTYIPVHAMIARKLRRIGVPYIICPRGGMTCYAQRSKWLKKQLGSLLFFRRMVAHAAALHCLTEHEAAASTRWNRPVFVVGNGIQLPPEPDLASPGRSSQLRMVFIGRLAMKHKGLDLLLEACALIRSELLGRSARVELYGPDEQGSTKLLASRIAKLQLQDLVAVKEPVLKEAKASVLKQTDVFLHTSRYEGQPMAVLEALAFGVPCLLTPGTNMAQQVAGAGAGWQVEPSAVAIAEGLKKILRLESSSLRAAGAAARGLAVSRHHWQQVAVRSVEAYRKYAV